MKKKMSSEPILGHPNFDRRFYLETDASQDIQAAILFQKDEEGRRIILGYASQAFKPREKSWPAHERECAAASYGMDYFRHYLTGRTFTLLTDSEMIKHLKKPKEGRLASWWVNTQSFDFEVVHVPGKKNCGPDFLTRSPPPDIEIDKKTRDYQEMRYFKAIRTIKKTSGGEDFTISDGMEYNDWKQGQQNCPHLSKIRTTLEKPQKDQNPTEEQMVKFYELRDNLLYYRPPNQPQSRPRIYVPKSMITPLLKHFHNSLVHPSIRTTKNLMTRDFYWPQMAKIIRDFGLSCPTCNRRRIREKKVQGL